MMGFADVIIGMQFGSEAKGKVAALMSLNYDLLVRTGAPNAGHSVWINGERFIFQCLPAGSIINRSADLVIGAGAIVDVAALRREIEWLNEHSAWGKNRLMVDSQATMIQERHVREEWGGLAPCSDTDDPESCDLGGDCHKCDKTDEDDLWRSIGSTRHGCGAALVERLWRRGKSVLAKDCDALRDLLDEHDGQIGDTVELINRNIDSGAAVQLEGTQGSGLSVYHGYYPYTTSRGTNAANWIMEAGISPRLVREIIGVVRTYPIRVAGNSGPAAGREITWEEIESRAGAPEGSLAEYTSVTKRLRRVFELSMDDLSKALMINRPTMIALTFVDYVNYEDLGVDCWCKLSGQSQDYISTLGRGIGWDFPIRILSTGPQQEHTINVDSEILRHHLATYT